MPKLTAKTIQTSALFTPNSKFNFKLGTLTPSSL